VTQDSSKANQDGPKNATENAPEKLSDKAVDHASEKKSPAPKTAQAAPAAKVSKPADRVSVAKTKPVGRTNQVKVGLLWVIVLLIIVMVAGLGYWQWQAQSQRAALTNDQSGQSDNLQYWQQQQQVLAKKLDALRLSNEVALDTMSVQQTNLENNQARMDEALVSALEAVAKNQLDEGQALPQWELAEAEYLLRLASQRLAMEQASESAVALLKAADIIIRDSEQVGTYGIRRAIAADLAALSLVPSVDVEGVYASLAALSSLAAQLTFIPPQSDLTLVPKIVPINAQSTAMPASVNTNDWAQSMWQGVKHVGANVWGELRQLVKVQSRAQEDQQLLTPAAELLVRMRIEMALSQTQVALLRRQQTIYDQSLVSVKQLLGQYYRSSDLVSQAILTQIEILEKVKVLVNMPNINGSLTALQAFISTLHETPTEPLVGE